MRLDLEPRLAQKAHGAPRPGRVVAAAVQGQDVVVHALDADLDLGRPEAPHAQRLRQVEPVGPGLERQPDAADRGRLVRTLCRQKIGPAGVLLASFDRRARMGGGPVGNDLVVAAAGRRLGRVDLLALHGLVELPVVHRGLERQERIRRRLGRQIEEVVHRLETAQDEPHLVALGIARPGAAEDDQLHLVDRMPRVAEGTEAGERLPVRVELVLRGPLGAGLGRQVALRHPYVAGTEDAPARTREGLGQHGHRRHAAPGTDRLHPHPVDERLLARGPGSKRAVAADQLALREETPAVLRVPAQQILEVALLEP